MAQWTGAERTGTGAEWTRAGTEERDRDMDKVEREERITQTAARLGVSPVFVGLPAVSLIRQSPATGCE